MISSIRHCSLQKVHHGLIFFLLILLEIFKMGTNWFHGNSVHKIVVVNFLKSPTVCIKEGVLFSL